MNDLHDLRLRGMRIVAGVVAALSLGLLGWSVIEGEVIFGITAVILAVAPIYLAATRRADLVARVALGCTLPIYAALFLALGRGHGWIIDMHMTFFAFLAVLAILADWRAILGATVVTAVHHLVLNFVAPAYLFSDGADFLRVVFHAVVVVVESAVLVALCVQLEQLIVGQARQREERERAEEIVRREREIVAANQQHVIEQVQARLATLSEGKLQERIGQPFSAEYEGIRAALNQTCNELERLVGSVAGTADSVARGTTEIRSASDDLAERTARDSSQIEQLASTTHRLTDELLEAANLCDDTRSITHRVKQEVDEGKGVIDNVSEAMSRIEGSAGKIREITDIIDGIAFQTNLLALNAGVEAARAGESGKGFAVVAQEVRALAQRSTEAASSIKTLILQSSADIGDGAKLVEKMGGLLSLVVDEFAIINDRIDEIASRATSNTDDFGKVRGAIDNLGTSMQQNAAMVEETNAAQHELSTQADELRAWVGKFEYKGSIEFAQKAPRLVA